MPLGGMLTAGGLALAGGVAGGVMNYIGGNRDREAQAQALQQQQEATNRARQQSAAAAHAGSQAVLGAGQYGGETLEAYGGQAVGELTQGRDYALGQTLGYGQEAAGSLASGYGDAIGTLQGADQGSRVNQLMDDPSGYMAQDPGYQFRQQQGEQAINRMNAAQGGRFSGRAAKELGQFNQGLASQEFGNAYQRAAAADQAQFGRASGIAGLQAGQGSALAGHQTGMGDRLSGLFTGTGSQLANAYQGIGSGLASQANTTAANYGNILTGSAANNANITQAMIPAYSQAAQNAGGGYRDIGNAIQGVTNMGASLAAGYGGYMAGQGGNAGVAPDGTNLGSWDDPVGYNPNTGVYTA